jgi:2-polyprenyl-6-methoxyphenol hydroxylase-like FAD-dependent oxidoreductase
MTIDTPGVDFMPGRTVTGVDRAGVTLRDGGRVDARLVVGADGRGSSVARLAGIRGRVKPHGRFFYWAYWRGLEPDTPRSRTWFLEPDAAYTFPNEDGLTLALVGPRKSRLPEFRADLEGAYHRMLAALPDAPRFDRATREGRIIGKLELPNVLRPAAQAGIALVGDAALSSDPLWGIGCGWAFQSADWLVEETAGALIGGGDLDAALERYRRVHFRRLAPHHYMIASLANGRRATAMERTMYRAATRDETVRRTLNAIGSRREPPAIIFRPRTLARIVRAGIGGPDGTHEPWRPAVAAPRVPAAA